MRLAFSLHLKHLFSLILLVFLLLGLPIGAVASQAAGEKRPAGQPPMRFILVHHLLCMEECPGWISAEGRITSDTPAQLRKILKKIGNRKPPIVFRSEGGDVDAAYAMGRMIRKAGLETAVGGTRLKDCPADDLRCDAAIAKDGTALGNTYSDGAYCFSACPLAFAGGTSRVASQWAFIGVHQITTIYNKVRVSYRIEYKIVNGKKKEISRKEVARKSAGQSSSTKLGKKATVALTSYLKEMGVEKDLLDHMMSATPDSIKIVPPAEAIRIGLMTDMLSYSEWPGMPRCAPDAAAEAVCHSRRTVKTPVAEAPVLKAPAQNASGGASESLPKTRPMDFLLMSNGNCLEECRQWISADGDITPDTPAQLEAVLKTLGERKLPIVLQSNGGDMDAAFAMGRIIRAAGLETSIGRTQLPNCPKLDPRCKASIAKSGSTEGEVFAGRAYCLSTCTLVLMSGTPRIVGYSDIGLVRPTTSQYTKFFAYFDEMGVSAETYETMMLATSIEREKLLPSHAFKLGVINGVIPYDEEPGLHVCGPEAKESLRCPRNQKPEITPAALAN
ncbi:hypothetical protein HJA87_01705 [Rhizobium bangladeshense]|uniref:Clp protease family protein n=3 Tax=Rhizobium bangladeshense TaxID=1138189 RepID=A0ABS7LCB3_9HYPH|nr:hypothetical protein [Rhizobium bangladeshense]MBX4866615.1 hypothetical protein [Rhizobium bangladeshense]MBX4873421.1 hypothetical protein [Rhizobium bangladeshense]MBX4883330.1 hypothetical protein [Rhizobium bangladeshense]MBX4918993.1 hypothetical protein [Rhizobium bangladeshense]MBY3588611.1 hypothetical protein [Rhizobium bangladeshense]